MNPIWFLIMLSEPTPPEKYNALHPKYVWDKKGCEYAKKNWFITASHKIKKNCKR